MKYGYPVPHLTLLHPAFIMWSPYIGRGWQHHWPPYVIQKIGANVAIAHERTYFENPPVGGEGGKDRRGCGGRRDRLRARLFSPCCVS